MLLRSGIDLREAMQYACSLLPNCEIIDKLQACVQGMNEGESFCDVIRKEQLYDCLLYTSCDYDDAGSIGKRYRRNDAIGTPFCITVDFETEQDNCVTVRERDTMKQERVNLNDLVSYIEERIKL